MTPCILHQTWKVDDIPGHLKEFQQSWRTHHPAWEYRFWNDTDNERLIAEHYPEFIDLYRRLTPAILKVDFVRLAYMDRFGGVYADLDCEVLKPLDPLLESGKVVVGREFKGIGRELRGQDYIINALLISPPGHPLWLEVMRRMAAGCRPRRRFENHSAYVIRMGIAVLDTAVSEHQANHEDITVMGHEAFYPAAPSQRLPANRRRMAVACSSYTIHHYEDSWFSPGARLLNGFLKLLQRAALNRDQT